MSDADNLMFVPCILGVVEMGSTSDGTTTLRHTNHVTTYYMIYHTFDLYFK
jgi:hypothetical protein